MRTRAGGGSARTHGYAAIPKHLKNRGLGEHPKMTSEIAVQSPCGIRAFLLSHNAEYYLNDIEGLTSDAAAIGQLLGIDGQYMENGDFDRLLELTEWNYLRLIIFRLDGCIEYAIQGKQWEWDNDNSRNVPDPNTITIMRDSIEKHYWWIEVIKPLAFSHRFRKGNEAPIINCYYCFKQFTEPKYKEHECRGVQSYQCRKCKTYFSTIVSLNDHNLKATPGWNCEVCKKDSFNGSECFQRHMHENCFPPPGLNKLLCGECNRYYINSLDYDHDCNAFGSCHNCEKQFDSRQERQEHICFMQHRAIFWDPVQDEKWESHWFYDFETTRGMEYSEDEYQHEVMAWCIRLMVPCDATRLHIQNAGIIKKIQLRIDETPPQIKNDIKTQVIGDSIRIYGKNLITFLYLCEKVLVKNTKHDKWKPVLWAHNGSKFDAKFILDHYLNTENMDLAGDKYEQHFINPTLENVGGESKWVHKTYQSRRNVVSVNMVGSKVLQMRVRNITFRCSHAHHTAPLRDLPKRFGLSLSVKKGEFPYPLLKPENWSRVFDTFPAIEYYDIDSMTESRRTQVLEWYNQQPKNQPWDFDKELWEYLFADVDVGVAVMEAYHEKSQELHMDLWQQYPENQDKHCSPLQSSTSPGWALNMYRTWFMPTDEIVVLRPNAAKFIRDSLRGGRTDKRCNWLDMTPERFAQGDRIEYYDFKSLYPSVQKCSVHNTHFPIGPPEWLRFKGATNNDKLVEDMGDMTGFISISFTPKKYTTHPTLHRVGNVDKSSANKKLLFELDIQEKQTYAWPEIQEAIRCGEIDVNYIHEGVLFKKGTNVFNEYVDFFFKVKDEAEIQKNEGLRSLAKLLLNSLWGKLGQRSYAVKEWVEYTERRDYLLQKFESGEFELISCILKDEHRVFFEYRKKEDLNNLENTACHIAAFVSMWGRVILHKKLLSQHGMRALYCDTDSAIVYLRGGIDSMLYTGDKLGDLTDEVTKMAPKNFGQAYISEIVLLAPKTYALKIKDKQSDKVYVKVVCKGFEPSFANSKHVHFDSFKELVFTQYKLNSFMNGKRQIQAVPNRLYIRGEKRMSFQSSMARNEIVPVEVYRQKSITGKYDKGKTHPYDPRFIVPFSKSGLNPPPGNFMTSKSIHFE